MTEEKRSKIEQRAYEIWEREGCPDGKAMEHWYQAVAEIAREEAAARVAATKAKVAGPGKTSAGAAGEKKAPGAAPAVAATPTEKKDETKPVKATGKKEKAGEPKKKKSGKSKG